MITFGIVGVGWRAEFFLRIAQACPDSFAIAGVTGRTAEKVSAIAQRFGVRSFASIDDLARGAKPDFVVSSVPWEANPDIIKRLTQLGLPVLSETPPATSVAEMDELCGLVRQGARIQVAEQYFLQPHHAARLAFAQSGRIGEVTQAQVSAAHGYHGMSLIRRHLGIRFENVRITAMTFKSPILRGPDRYSPPQREEIVESEQELAWLEFDGRLGVFDFTGHQYRVSTREPRILVRGERGEIVNDTAVYMKDHLTPVKVNFQRHVAGERGNLEGQFLKGIQAGDEWIYSNPCAPARLFDDEIAIASLLLRMGDYVRGGPEVYSLAEACQDRYLDILVHDAIKRRESVRSTTQSWAVQ